MFRKFFGWFGRREKVEEVYKNSNPFLHGPIDIEEFSIEASKSYIKALIELYDNSKITLADMRAYRANIEEILNKHKELSLEVYELTRSNRMFSILYDEVNNITNLLNELDKVIYRYMMNEKNYEVLFPNAPKYNC